MKPVHPRLRRFQRKVMGRKHPAVVHDGDCRIYSLVRICTCGLFHALLQMPNRPLNRYFREQMDKQEEAFNILEMHVHGEKVHKEVAKFVRRVDKAHEATKKSKLRFGGNLRKTWSLKACEDGKALRKIEGRVSRGIHAQTLKGERKPWVCAKCGKKHPATDAGMHNFGKKRRESYCFVCSQGW